MVSTIYDLCSRHRDLCCLSSKEKTKQKKKQQKNPNISESLNKTDHEEMNTSYISPTAMNPQEGTVTQGTGSMRADARAQSIYPSSY